MQVLSKRRAAWLGLVLPLAAMLAPTASAQERLPWQDRPSSYEQRDYNRDDQNSTNGYGSTVPGGGYTGGYGSGSGSAYGSSGNAGSYGGGYSNGYGQSRQNDAYVPPRGTYQNGNGSGGYASNDRAYGQPYGPPPGQYERGYGSAYPSDRAYDAPPPRQHRDRTFSAEEIAGAGHRFFGSVSKGMASAIEYVFKRQGRPNGYILGEDAGGAFVAGLRYGEGVLYTRDAGDHKVYWQGPSLGYDFGGEGSKVMVLVYNLRDPSEIYDRFGGVAGSAYVVGGVGLNFQAKDHIVLAPIRAGVGLRFGANVGYLKYTPRPTWNPF
jgi:hypothetical protein